MRKIVIILYISLMSSCAIHYKKVNFNTESVKIPDTKNAIIKIDSDEMSNRLKKKWQRKGYTYHHLIIKNTSDKDFVINEKSLIAIADLEKAKIAGGLEVLDKSKFNRGLFYSMAALGALRSLGVGKSGKSLKIVFSPEAFFTSYITAPLFWYGGINSYISTQSRSRFQKDIANHYLLGYTIPSGESKEGFLLVNSLNPVVFQLRF